jgi:MAF protein
MAGEIPADYAIRLAATKAQAAANAQKPAVRSAGALVIAADTVVELDGLALGKPGSRRDASEMLQSLRGREHSVTTGLAVAAPGDSEILTGLETTIVRMRRYSDDEIDAYVASGGPFDKAGGYGIQDLAFAPAESVRGCYLNVVGLPLCRLSALLEKAEPGTGSAFDPGSCAACHTAADVKSGAAV